jgi:hypothetical protein
MQKLERGEKHRCGACIWLSCVCTSRVGKRADGAAWKTEAGYMKSAAETRAAPQHPAQRTCTGMLAMTRALSKRRRLPDCGQGMEGQADVGCRQVRLCADTTVASGPL